MVRVLMSAVLLALALPVGTAPAQTSPPIKRLYLSQGEWRGSVLTASGRQIMAETASVATPHVVTEIDINGMADLAPNPEGQKRTSDARVAAVRAELVRIGVAERDIGVEAVSTPDGEIPAPTGDLAARRIVIVAHY